MLNTTLFKRILPMFICFCVAVACLPFTASQAEAKTVTAKGVYIISMFNNSEWSNTKVTMTSKKIKVKGRVDKYYSHRALYGKNFTFKISPKVKYYYMDYLGSHRMSKAKSETFFYSKYGVPSLRLHVKGGKVVKMVYSS